MHSQHAKGLRKSSCPPERREGLATHPFRPRTDIRPRPHKRKGEKLLIRQTLTHVTSNREEAARALGISRRALQYKLKQYGLLESPATPTPPAAEPGRAR